MGIIKKLRSRYISTIDNIENIEINSYKIIHDRTHISLLIFDVNAKVNGINMKINYNGLIFVDNNNNYTGFDKGKYDPLQFKYSFSSNDSMKCKGLFFTYYKNEVAMNTIIRYVINKIKETDYNFKLR